MAVPATIHNTLGLLFIVAIITAALYGAGMLQGWFYFRKHKKQDPLWLQYLVAFVLICDTIQEALICHAVYKYAVSMHDDPLAMTRMESSIMIELFFGGALAFAVQIFYCHRILRLSKNWFLAGFIFLVCLASLLLIYIYTGLTLGFQSLGQLIEQKTLATVLNAFNAGADLLITLGMIYSLNNAKTGFRKTTDMLNRLIIFTFNTGIPTTLCAVLDLITLNTLPNTFIYMGFYLIMDRFYTNCLLVTLNSRDYIRHAEDYSTDHTHESMSLHERGTVKSNPHHQAYMMKGPLSMPQLDRKQRMPDTPTSIAIQIDKSTIKDAYGEEDHGSDTLYPLKEGAQAL